MRISTSQFQFESVARMLDQQAKLSKTQQQVATGRKILSPSDDPAGSARILDLNQVISVNEQYQRNADAAKSRLDAEESAIQGMQDLYQRGRELAVQGLSDTLSDDNRKAIEIEMRQLLDEMTSLAGRKDANGEYIFSGFQGNQNPVGDNGSGTYTYLGDQGTRQIQIGPSRQIAAGDTGFDVFFNIQNTSENAFSVLYKFADSLANGTQDASSLDDFDAVMNNFSNINAKIGARVNSIDSQKGVNDSLVLQSKTVLSSIQDLDLAEAVTKLNLQQVGLQAAQQSYTRVQGLSLFNYLP